MKKFKLLPMFLMLVLCVAAFGMGVFAAGSTNHTIGGQIEVLGANYPVIVDAWIEGVADSNQSTGLVTSNTEVLKFNNLQMDMNSASELSDTDIVIGVKVTNKSNAELGAYFLKSGATIQENAAVGDVFTGEPIKDPKDSTKTIINSTVDFYKYVGVKSDDNAVTTDEATFYIKFSAVDWLYKDYNESLENLLRFNYKLVIEAYNANIKTETYDLAEAENGSILRLSSSYETTPAASPMSMTQTLSASEGTTTRTEITSSTFTNDATTAVTNIGIVLPNTVTTIGADAFNGNVAVTKIGLPDKLTSVDYNAFTGCTNFDKSTATISKSTYIYHYGVKYSTNGNVFAPTRVIDGTGLTVANYSVLEGTKDMSDYAFCDVESEYEGVSILEQITFPESMVSIGNTTYWNDGTITPYGEVFVNCSNLSKVTFTGNNLRHIGQSAFSGCEKLTEIEIPEGVTDISFYAFSGCPIKHFTFPSTVERLGEGMLDYETIETITFLGDAPDPISHITENYTFFSATPTKLTAIYVNDKDEFLESLEQIYNSKCAEDEFWLECFPTFNDFSQLLLPNKMVNNPN